MAFGLLGYKLDDHKARVRCLPGDAWFYHNGLTSPFYNWSLNFRSMMHWIKFCKKKLAKISALFLTFILFFFKGVSSDCVDFEISNLLILFSISS